MNGNPKIAFDWRLAQAGSDYYLAARFAMKAQRFVAGNLFHRAVEMFLKSGLAKKGHTETELWKRFGHSLDKLWRAFKTGYPDAALARHDATVSSLDESEEIRYPPDHSFGVTMQWDEPTSPLPATTKQYTLLVSNIDAPVADVLATTQWNAGLLFLGNNQATLDALNFRNDQKEYLRKVV
jgi:hypothetical protein